MKHLFAFLLLLPVMLAAVEVKFPRQQVPRSNTIRIDDVTLNIDRASSSSKDWMVTAKRGNETRQAIIIRNGINRLRECRRCRIGKGDYHKNSARYRWVCEILTYAAEKAFYAEYGKYRAYDRLPYRNIRRQVQRKQKSCYRCA